MDKQEVIAPIYPDGRMRFQFRFNSAFIFGLMPMVLIYLVFFILPILGILHLSIYEKSYTLEHFLRIIHTPIYTRVLINTIMISILVTLGSVILSYPYAYLMATARPIAAQILTFVVLLPFWTSALVRTTAWIVILQKRGILNTLLTRVGILEEPVAFVFNLSGVLIGMIHVLMPFVVFPLYASFRSIDSNLISAAEGLGAGSLRIFTRIIAPLTAPGVFAGSLIVFMHALGYFITPSLLGGPKQTMIAQMISHHINEELNWGMAAALAIMLLAVTLLIFFVFQRFLGLDRLWGGMEGGGGAGEGLGSTTHLAQKTSMGSMGSAIVGIAVGVFLISPIVAIIPMSLSASPFLVFPPPSYSFTWFENFLATPKWIRSLQNSVHVSIMAVFTATVLGTAAAMGMSRLRFRLKGFIEAFLILPMVVPVIVLSISLYYFYASFGFTGSKVGLAIGHAILGSPLVFITVSASLKTFDRNLELAAYGLGASRVVMFQRVMLPHIWPGIAAGGLFAFIVSFDDVILALFLTNIRSRTLPKVMYEGVAHEIDPTITAVAVLLICFSLMVLITNIIFSRLRTSR
jgi:putative spermidine/putrescine transport system permease protein